MREWDAETFDRLAQYAKSFGVTKALELLYGELRIPTNDQMDRARERLMDDKEWNDRLRESEQEQRKRRDLANELWANRFLDAWKASGSKRWSMPTVNVLYSGILSGRAVKLDEGWSTIIQEADIPHECRDGHIWIDGNLPLDIVSDAELKGPYDPVRELRYGPETKPAARQEWAVERMSAGWYRIFPNRGPSPVIAPPLPAMSGWQLELARASKVVDLYVSQKAEGSPYDRCLIFDEGVACAYDGEKWDMGTYIKAAQMAIVGTHRIDLSRAPSSPPESP